MNVLDRQDKRKELAMLGVPGSYLDSWQPRVDNWRHIPYLNTEGTLVKPAGMPVPNQPDDMDSALRRARRGVLPTKPSSSCRCKGCRERDWSDTVVDDEGYLIDAQVRATRETKETIRNGDVAPKPSSGRVITGTKCLDCDYVVTTKKRPSIAMASHRRMKHKKVAALVLR